MVRIVLQDGRLREEGRIELDVDDPAFQRGLAVFETMRSYGGRVPHLGLHLDRLQGSVAALDLAMPPRELLRREVHQALELLGEEGVLRISLTAGGSRVVQARTLPEAPDSMRVVTRPFAAHPWLPGRVKHISRAQGVVAVRQAGVDEVLWVDRGDNLLEGTYTNVCAVRQGVVHTPADDGRILPGITRHFVLAAARGLGLEVHEGACPAAGPWDELYLTSSLKLLVPVVELDGAAAPGEGPVGARLRAEVQQRLVAG